MTPSTGDFAPVAARMRDAGLPAVVIDTFAHYYAQLAEGHTGMIPEASIRPVTDLPDVSGITPEEKAAGREALPHTVTIKLNGGLGTGMGLARAKSLLTVRDGLTILDIIARQALATGVPLILMDSFSTRKDTLDALAAYPELRGDLPLDFLQHKVPKITREDLSCALWPADPDLEWCPPGHGDLYTALQTSGLLRELLALGYRYAFVSNADNLGAVMDTDLLGCFAARGYPFMMEVADRTAADRKGGHLARTPDGGLVLREAAQCPPEDREAFQDITRHRFFNTNNLWLDLKALDRVLRERQGLLGLPMIRNAKTVDPRDPASTPVYQLETAMGAAISAFPGAAAIRIPKTRFAPIKKTNDLLDLRSDNYVLAEDFQVLMNPERRLGRAVIDLDPAFFGFVDAFAARFPAGPPSLLGCERLVVRGDVVFGRGVVLRGEVRVDNPGSDPLTIPDGTVLSGEWPPA